jgi:hypothetical protein
VNRLKTLMTTKSTKHKSYETAQFSNHTNRHPIQPSVFILHLPEKPSHNSLNETLKHKAAFFSVLVLPF